MFKYLSKYGFACECQATRTATRPFTDLLGLVDELHEGGLVDVDGLSVPVVQAHHEVEEVGLAQVGGRLLGELDGGHAAPETKRKTRL